MKYLIKLFFVFSSSSHPSTGEKGYKEGHEHEEGKKGHHDKVRRSVHILNGIIYKFKTFPCPPPIATL